MEAEDVSRKGYMAVNPALIEKTWAHLFCALEQVSAKKVSSNHQMFNILLAW